MVQKQVAHILKISQQQYALYEQGIREMPIHHYETLARFYNVTIEYMIGMTNEPSTLDGRPYKISKNINITNKGGNNKINIKN